MQAFFIGNISVTASIVIGVVSIILISVLGVILCAPKEGMVVERQPSRAKDENVMSENKDDEMLFIDDDVVGDQVPRESHAAMPSNYEQSYVEGSSVSRDQMGSVFEPQNPKNKFPTMPMRRTKKKERVQASYAEY